MGGGDEGSSAKCCQGAGAAPEGEGAAAEGEGVGRVQEGAGETNCSRKLESFSLLS